MLDHIGDNISYWYKLLKYSNINNHNNNQVLDQDYLRKVHYYRTPDRAGLIRARLYGTHYAQGQILFFLDSHCEVNKQWLEPLLKRISQNRKIVVCPIIDLIDPDTFAYTSSPIVKGGFNWYVLFIKCLKYQNISI